MEKSDDGVLFVSFASSEAVLKEIVMDYFLMS